MMLTLAPHPLLEVAVFTAEFVNGVPESPPWLLAALASGADVPMRSSDDVRAKVRDVLRVGGFKPTGRSKPASEYLIRAASEGQLGAINGVVDACNVVSLHSGLPISVVDADRVVGTLGIGIARAGDQYVFNAGGQVIDIGGLVCLGDNEGPCANAVKDAQRTKTHAGSTRVVVVVWGAALLVGRAETAAAWYRDLLHRMGATTTGVTPVEGIPGWTLPNPAE
jgi:DNA/RNA-binding domain of Phe-tRNA-synthetase-like protein